MKWNGTVSQLAKTAIATRFAAAKTTHAASIHRSPEGQASRSAIVDAVPGAAHGRDGAGAELRPQASHAHVEDVRRGIEAVPPDGFEQALLRHGRARMAHQLLEQEELALRERDGAPAGVDRPAEQIEPQASNGELGGRVAVRGAKPRVHAGQER